MPRRPASPAPPPPGTAHGSLRGCRGGRALPLGPERLAGGGGGGRGGAPISNDSQGPAARLGSRPRAPAGTGSDLAPLQPAGSRKERAAATPGPRRAAFPRWARPLSAVRRRFPQGRGSPRRQPLPARPRSLPPHTPGAAAPRGGARPHDSISKACGISCLGPASQPRVSEAEDGEAASSGRGEGVKLRTPREAAVPKAPTALLSEKKKKK